MDEKAYITYMELNNEIIAAHSGFTFIIIYAIIFFLFMMLILTNIHQEKFY